MDPAVSMQIYAVHLYESIEDKEKFYMEIVKVIEFLSRNYDILQVYEEIGVESNLGIVLWEIFEW